MKGNIMKEKTWILHLADRHNCSVMESLKPGDEKEILLILHDVPNATPVHVRTKRTTDGEGFTALTPDGHEIGYTYADLLQLIKEKKPAV